MIGALIRRTFMFGCILGSNTQPGGDMSASDAILPIDGRTPSRLVLDVLWADDPSVAARNEAG